MFRCLHEERLFSCCYIVFVYSACLITIIIMCSVLWDIPPCSQLKVSWLFTSMRQLASEAVLLATCLVYSSTLKLEVTADYVVLQLFITTAVKNLKPCLVYDTFWHVIPFCCTASFFTWPFSCMLWVTFFSTKSQYKSGNYHIFPNLDGTSSSLVAAHGFWPSILVLSLLLSYLVPL